MRGVLLSLAFAFALAAATPARSTATAASARPLVSGSTAVYALQIPDKKVEITVGERSGGGAWYRSPVWIAIGVIAIVVVLLLIVLVARGGGGTTIVRE